MSLYNATLSHIRVTPRKAMLIANLVRGLPVNSALLVLKFSPRRRTAKYFEGVIKSALANANQRGVTDLDELVISRLEIGKGPTMKRFRARSMGRASKINKKTSHIFVGLSER